MTFQKISGSMILCHSELTVLPLPVASDLNESVVSDIPFLYSPLRMAGFGSEGALTHVFAGCGAIQKKKKIKKKSSTVEKTTYTPSLL